MRKYTSYLIICLLCCISCAKVEREGRTGGDDGKSEFAFSASIDGENGWVPLRTKGDATISDLRDNAGGNGWGVYAYYTGPDNYSSPSDVDGIIFNNRKVWWDGSAWQYYVDTDHQKEYWPMDAGDKVTFFAYAPYKDYSGAVSVDPDLGPQVTYTATTDLSAQKDLLWGTNTSGLPHRNVNLATYYDADTNPAGTVDFHFRHAPAKLHFTINGATLGDESGAPYTSGSASSNTAYDAAANWLYPMETTGGTYQANTWSTRYTLYYAYRKKTVTITQRYRRTVSGFKILLNEVDMTNFHAAGKLLLNNSDAFIPAWTPEGGFIDYHFGTSQLSEAIANPGNETTLSNGWGTTYIGVDNDPSELLRGTDNHIYMVPKAAAEPGPESDNINISVRYHIIGISKTVEFTRTTTTVSYQRATYYYNNNNTSSTNRYYLRSNGNYSNNTGDAAWTDVTGNANYPSTTSFVDGASADVGSPVFNYSQDDDGRGFKAVGAINSDILGGRDYTINLYLDGRELNLTVIPQQWDLEETLYDYDQTLNPILQALTYDSDFVYQVVNDNVYINNRMGKFYFRLGSGKYLYWQASLVGDDAFAFTDENGEYLLDGNGDYLTSIRGNIGEEMNYIYVKATNTSSPVTSSAKLRIYLFDSDNHAIVALPIVPNWLFLNATYTGAGGATERVQEWTVVQAAN